MAKIVHTFKIKTLTNRVAFENCLKLKHGIKGYNGFLNSLETKEFQDLLYSHGLNKDVYQCDDIQRLFSVYEELQQHVTPLSQAALVYGNAASRPSLERLIKYLLEINNGQLF